MEKWRHLIEPTVLESISPISWDEVKAKNPLVFEGKESVLLALPNDLLGRKMLLIWVAAGNLSEVSDLFKQCEEYAKDKFDGVCYVGRKGWVKTHGFKEIAVIGVKGF
jgi:hypothetical protein